MRLSPARPATLRDDDAVAVIDRLLQGFRPRNFSVRLWNGAHLGPEPGEQPLFTLAIRHPAALRAMLVRPTELNLAESYIYGALDIEGRIDAMFPLGRYLLDRPRTVRDKLRGLLTALTLPRLRRPDRGRPPASLNGRRHSLERDRRALSYHYDVSTDFYRLWLGEQLVYSCGYYESDSDRLAQAQEQKLRYICRKLRLQPHARLLDIGCGWGGLMLHAAKHLGVRCVGITLNASHADFVKDRIAREGLADRCQVELLHYREIPRTRRYDSIVSVEMYEHVGQAQLPAYFRTVRELLSDGGLMLNQGIAIRATEPVPTGSFANAYVFPDGELVSIGCLANAAEGCGLHLVDLESLRRHYCLTLRQWLQNLEGGRSAAVALTNEAIYRIWRLYLGYALHGFQTGRFDLYQALFSRDGPGSAPRPLTRRDWYAC